MAKLINGNGNPAIYAAEDADLIASLAGNVTCIANVGNKYAATEEDATTIRLDDGVIITKEGRRIQLEAGESDTFYIPTGTSGQTNYYIIGYKLVQNADSTQVAEQFVQKMNSSSETIIEDTFRSGATEVYVSVYRVTQVGFTIDSISGLLPELLDNASIKDNIDQINSDLASGRTYETVYTATGSASKTVRQLIDEFSATARDLFNSGKEVRIVLSDTYILYPVFHDANRVSFCSLEEVGGGLLYERVICGTGTTTLYTEKAVGGDEADHSEEASTSYTFKLEQLK